jgi:lipoate-protein ligase A
MYAVVLSYARRPELRAIHSAHRHVLDALATVLGRCAPGLTRAGTSDLVMDDRKVSGNSLRCQRTHLLYHGTLLYDMPLEWVARYLRTPPREPDYRAQRGHQEFLTTIPATREDVTAAVIDAFNAQESLTQWPQELVGQLVEQRYGVETWNLQGRS